ncbi:MAG: TetR/AcrR family transcriptional regulator [Verrucomicrobia bacterium]|nr:TetR/AcrR family transcriptional regulator [Verrucomicrobiota bacterium]
MNEAPQKETTREKLIAAASRLFAERGFDGVSVREIVAAAQANLGAITYHFGGKEELFAAVIETRIEPLMAIAKDVMGSSASPKQKLAEALHRSAQYILHEDPTLKVFFAEAMQGGSRLPEAAVKSLDVRNKMVQRLIEEGIERGDFRNCDAELVSWFFFGSIMSFVLHRPLLHPEFRRQAYPEDFVRKIVDESLEIFFKGIEA